MADYSFDSILSSGGSIGEAWVPPSGSSGTESNGIWDSFDSLFKGAMGSTTPPSYSPINSNAASSLFVDHSGWTVATGGSKVSGANNGLLYVVAGLGFVFLLILVGKGGRR